MTRRRNATPLSSSPWTDPVFHLQATGSLNSGLGGSLPWWAAPPPSAADIAHQQAMQTPPETSLGGSADYGPGNARPDSGNDPMWRGQPSQDLPGGMQVSAGAMGRLLGAFTGAPGQAVTAGLNWWDRGHDSSPTNAADFDQAGAGDRWMNNWQNDASNYWESVHPGQGLGGNNTGFGSGFGAGGSGRDPYYGGTSPWDWGANYF